MKSMGKTNGYFLPRRVTCYTSVVLELSFLFTSFPGSLRLVQNGAGDVKEDVIMRCTGGGTLDALAFFPVSSPFFFSYTNI